ncbi:undecaprenyl diphosphate synthase [Natronospira proteinivora]|uniref:Ditrans,polycis-undecaprenyl-diphosphate synthase ((2E,6E)-farnesyl-diphosphate specific) n=1 Tax=Natronospira proteinivora TaxID=1807133 RepID=A0ABT1G5N7_9GAMM|nr:polyprenyl diphosphate synthase [Natronospira proteinivora]MCP1726621.1 undecaprenyl diphosphate synthase [Natronospira proteinivora]
MSQSEAEKPSNSILPRHVAIIMDGNGRWAKGRGRPRHMGHQAGAQAAEVVIESVARRGIPVLSLFAFSSENWSRPQGEIRRLMDLFRRAMKQAVPKLHENGVRVSFLGDRSRFPEDLQVKMGEAEQLTAANSGLHLNIAAGYGGRWDILQAARGAAQEVADGRIRPEDIDEAALGRKLSLSGLPAPDLFIRTGGERRISNYFLWDLAYTELYFTDCLWPDFDADALNAALADFSERERRFGGVGREGAESLA